jgi:predicted GH43/DUF377 family glycosyl hydrolase
VWIDGDATCGFRIRNLRIGRQQRLAKRVAENPIITPETVPPSEPGLEVVGAFNPGAVRFGDEILLLLRVAERPILEDPERVGVPVLNLKPSARFRSEWRC